MTMRTPQEHTYSALHDDYCNGLLSREEYETAFKRLGAPARPRRALLAWSFIGAVVLALALALIYAAQIGAL